MDALHSRSEPTQAPPEPRGKLEYMFRTMLVEAEDITKRSEALVKQLNTATMQMQTLPALLRKANAMEQDQATSRAVLQIQEAATQVGDARRHLRRSIQAMDVQRGRNLWIVGLVALGCGLAGGLAAALVLLFALK